MIPLRPEQEWSSVVYLIRRRIDGAIKIGTTTNLQSRLTGIQTGAGPCEVVHVEPGSVAEEQEYHREFREYRMHGEWFRCTGDLADFIHDRESRYRAVQTVARHLVLGDWVEAVVALMVAYDEEHWVYGEDDPGAAELLSKAAAAYDLERGHRQGDWGADPSFFLWLTGRDHWESTRRGERHVRYSRDPDFREADE